MRAGSASHPGPAYNTTATTSVANKNWQHQLALDGATGIVIGVGGMLLYQ